MNRTLTRRSLLKSAVVTSFPAIVPATVFGPMPPNSRINIGAIGVGRISRAHDLPGLWKYDSARITAVCDLDSKRTGDAKTLINGFYAKSTGKPYDGVTGYHNYHELLAALTHQFCYR
jgi:hypothetical protein